MAIDIDGFAVLGAIARAPATFAAVKADAIKAAKTFVGKQIKDKALTIGGLRAIVDAIGPETFDIVADALSDADIKAVIGKVDRENAEGKAATAAAQRKLMSDLACGAVAPAANAGLARAAKAPKAAKAAKTVVERSGNSTAMKAKRKTGA